jgi:hypothetical protein
MDSLKGQLFVVLGGSSGFAFERLALCCLDAGWPGAAFFAVQTRAGHIQELV